MHCYPSGRYACRAVLWLLVCAWLSAGGGWSAGPASAPGAAVDFSVPHPRLACTVAELARLRAALAGDDAGWRAPVLARVRSADAALARPLEFPPRGARHNQWYQCDACQTALQTTPAGAHRCPVCGREYTGAPYDDVVFGRRHAANLRAMLDCAWAYALTGEKKYADHAARFLLGYAERYAKYPRRGTAAWNFPYNLVTGGRLYDQTLSEASAMVTSIAPAYDLIHDSGALDADAHLAVRTKLIRPILDNIGGSWWNGGVCNWQSWHNAAMLWGGVMLADAAWIRRSLDDPRYGFYFQMANAVTDDGMWHEGTWGYHYYALQALAAQAEGARRIGIDLWRMPALNAMFALPLLYVMPDGKLPRFGDDVGSAPAGQPALMEMGFHNCDAGTAALLADALPATPVWESVLYGRSAGMAGGVPTGEMAAADGHPPAGIAGVVSRVFPAAGHVILRRNSPAGLAAALTFGPYGGYHAHLDKLSFVFYGLGRELGVDPGRAVSQAYRLPIHKNWYKATISHNTVLADGQSQRPCAGMLEHFKTGEKFAAAVLSAAPWHGVNHRRLLLLTDDFLLVADDLVAGHVTRFDWLYHNRGTQAVCAVALDPAPPRPDIHGVEYIENCRGGLTAEDVHVVFDDVPGAAELLLAGGAPTRVLVGDGPGRSVRDRVPLIMAGREGRTASFAALITPRSARAPAGGPARAIVVERVDGARLRVHVTAPAGAWRVTFGHDMLDVHE